MDFSFKSTRTRGLVGIGIVGVLGTAIWGGGLAKQHGYKRNEKLVLHDFKDSGSDLAFHTICNHGPVSMPGFVAKDFLKEFYNNRKERAKLAEVWVVRDNEVRPIKLSQEVHLIWGDDDKIFTSQTAEDTKRNQCLYMGPALEPRSRIEPSKML